MATFKKQRITPLGGGPFFEIIAIENALGDFTTCCQNDCGKTREGCLRVIGTEIGNFNSYGKIVHKKARGCSTFYKLLSYKDKKDGWDSVSRSMERDLTDFDPNYMFEMDDFFCKCQENNELKLF